MTDAEYMAAAKRAAERSDDRSRKVGCVIVAPDGTISEVGWNGFPHGVVDRDDRHDRPEKYFWIEHAERNAIYHAARMGRALRGHRIFLPWYPCMDCARAMIQTGLAEMICDEPPDFNDPKWGADFVRVGTLLAEGGVTVRFLR